MVDKKIKFRIKGHASFILREGWINKGISAVYQDNNLFREKKSVDLLGVGSNMVQSIRYWMKASNLITESRGRGAELTNLGEMVRQYDPCLEELFTVWILHCNLVCNKDLATVWYLFYNFCEAEDFTREEIFIQVQNEMQKYTNKATYSESSLRDDVTVLTNMYSRNRKKVYEPEDNNISPFIALELMSENRDKYSKNQPNLSKLDKMVVLYQLLIQLEEKQDESISIDSILENENSVGKILNLSRVVVNKYLDMLTTDGYITVNRTAGIDMVYKNGDFTSFGILNEFYQNIAD